MQGVTIRNAHVKKKRSTSSFSKVIATVKVVVIRNTHVKLERSTSSGSKVIGGLKKCHTYVKLQGQGC